eukprot:462582-Rhodomonas_salina.1
MTEQVEYGLFAVQTIEAGQAIGEYVGVLSSFSEEEQDGVFISSQDSEMQVQSASVWPLCTSALSPCAYVVAARVSWY